MITGWKAHKPHWVARFVLAVVIFAAMCVAHSKWGMP